MNICKEHGRIAKVTEPMQTVKHQMPYTCVLKCCCFCMTSRADCLLLAGIRTFPSTTMPVLRTASKQLTAETERCATSLSPSSFRRCLGPSTHATCQVWVRSGVSSRSQLLTVAAGVWDRLPHGACQARASDQRTGLAKRPVVLRCNRARMHGLRSHHGRDSWVSSCFYSQTAEHCCFRYSMVRFETEESVHEAMKLNGLVVQASMLEIDYAEKNDMLGEPLIGGTSKLV